MDIYCIASGAHTIPKHGRGALTNPDPGVREEARRANRRAIDLCAQLGAHMIIWPGIDGYNYPFQCDYTSQWTVFLEGIADAVEHANGQGRHRLPGAQEFRAADEDLHARHGHVDLRHPQAAPTRASTPAGPRSTWTGST